MIFSIDKNTTDDLIFSFSTTTIGFFLKQVMFVKLAKQKGELSNNDYQSFLKQQISSSIKFQEDIDMMVHGEFERNDMVEYFGEYEWVCIYKIWLGTKLWILMCKVTHYLW